MKKIFNAFCLVYLFLLTSCGNGGGGGSVATSIDTSPTLTGFFIDAPTKGLTYRATPSATSGTTDSEGKFNYKAGDSVSFSIPTNSGAISLGSTIVSTPSGSNAVVSVLSLPNGTQAAQVLQTLNKGTVSNIDVSDIILSAAEVAKLNSYIANPTATAPSISVAGSTKQLTDAAVATAAAVNSLSTTSRVQNVSATSVSNALSGKVIYSQGVTLLPSGESSTVHGIAYFNPNGTVSELWTNGTLDSNARWSTGNNVFTSTKNSLTVSGSINYMDNNIMASSYTTFGGDKVNAVGYFVKPVSYADWAGKTFELTGNTNSVCSPSPTYIAVSADGTQLNALCKVGGTPYASGSLSQYAPLPGVWIIQETMNGKTSTFFIGLLEGGTLASGQIFLYSPSTTTSGFHTGIESIKLAQ
jgi:hypothetical protein